MRIICDMGEGLDEIDATLMPHIDLAAIACGGHAGSADSLRRTIAIAKHHNVGIAAHPSYPDRKHFGRRSLTLSLNALKAALDTQLALFIEIASELLLPISAIKAHGALYNDAARSPELTHLLLELAKRHHCPLVLPAHGAEWVSSDASVLREAFADRAYGADGQLVPRVESGALLDVSAAKRQAQSLLGRGEVERVSAPPLKLSADLLCIHSDSPNAVALTQAIRTLAAHR